MEDIGAEGYQWWELGVGWWEGDCEAQDGGTVGARADEENP
jgi:hypothetical protein